MEPQCLINAAGPIVQNLNFASTTPLSGSARLDQIRSGAEISVSDLRRDHQCLEGSSFRECRQLARNTPSYRLP
jgi:hypothetical protein